MSKLERVKAAGGKESSAVKRMKWLAPGFALALAWWSLFASHVPALLAQQEQQRREGTEDIPGGCFICGNRPGMHTAMFEGADWFGTLAWDACPIKKYSENNPEKLKGVCRKIKEELKFTSFKDSCPSLAPYCPEEKKSPDTKCEPPAPPWFGDSADCKDVQEAQITATRTAITVYLCGYRIFTYSDKSVMNDPLMLPAYKAALRDALRANVGKVCCNRFRQAARTGKPCNARTDIDCDGKPNQSDVDNNGVPEFGERAVRVPPDSSFDPFPDGMTDDEIAPSASECKGCKWVLRSGELKCSPDGRQRHAYQARWYCPSTRVEVDKFHYAPATAPCTPPNRSIGP